MTTHLKILLKLLTAPALALALALLLLGPPWLALAQGPVGPTFTYQGRLLKGGTYLANSVCDFQFALWDAPAGGNPVGLPQTVLGVTLKDGYFTVVLNGDNEFGPQAFSGDRRYLAVAVRCASDPGFVALDSQRVELKAAPYALYALNTAPFTTVPWSAISGLPAGFADNEDNFNTYTAGFGLALTSSQFSVVTGPLLAQIPPNTYQARVTGSCSNKFAIRVFRSDGTVDCVTDNQEYVAGEGLILSGTTFSIDEVYVQRRVINTCGSTQAIRAVNPDGTVQCEDVPQGDITEVVAGPGLEGGGDKGAVTLGVATGGITSSMLADYAVDNSRLALNLVSTPKLADGAVTSAIIANGTIQLIDLGGACADGQVMKWKSGQNSWSCDIDNITTYTAGDGLDLANNVLSARVGSGVKIDGSDNIALDFAGSGTAATAARSDHTHGHDYVWFTDPAPNGAGKDVTGNYTDGFNVVGIRGKFVAATAPGAGQILRYNGSQWAPASYNFPLTLQIETVQNTQNNRDAEAWVYCSSSQVLTGGGCKCDGGSRLEDSGPTGGVGWYCNCDSSNTDTTAYAICVQQRYE